ncbi:DUF192 domain-containing protein [Pararhodospirillum photometricum]|uniref:DUF192 domain-containing protein n=1 Tax=Pararhodospirillum photometricum DSM 122 TaxID=1150469 RepID=H6SNU6_PARPM|nr:DUF192 domain-containing protein [Pararhodospirillum photometricum]CCG07018.1 Putative uncharacterized protein [Pararhodospirillum photometricum DSM 122]
MDRFWKNRIRSLGGSLTLALALALVPGTPAALAQSDPVAARAALTVKFPRSHLTIETRDGRRLPFEIEEANTPQRRMVGLMFRKTLAADAGMLFLWGEPGERTMWMKNTFIPLDMLFLDDRGWIVHVAHNAEPKSEAIIASPVPASAVLEIAGGTSQLFSIEEGDRVLHPLLSDQR